MATKDEMREAAKKFWGPLKQGKDIVSGDIKISVASRGQYRTIRIGPDDPLRRGIFVAGYWESPDIRLLQLCANGRNGHEDEKIGELLFWIVAEAREPSMGSRLAKPPESITDLITVGYTGEDAKTWLLGELYDDRVEIKSTWEPEPFRIGDDGLHARWMDGQETWLELSADPMAEYNRVFRRPIESEEVPEIATAESKLDKLQKRIDAIETDIRQLRAKERDFTSTNIEMARRVGKLNEYEELLRQRDEAMWRENPRGREDNFDIILKVETYHGEQSSIDVNGPDGDFTFLLVQVRNGVVLNDETAYGYTSGDDAFKHCHVPELPCYFSEGGVSSHVRPNHRNFDLVVRLDSTHDEDTSVEINTAFGATVFAIYTVTDGWVDNWQTDYGYLAEGEAVQAAGSDDKTLRIYHSLQEGPITPEAGPAVEVSESELDAIQRGIDKIEKAMDIRRKKDNDYKSTALQVAEAVGKRKKYEMLLKRRDELMWRGNPIKNLSVDTMKMVQAGEGFRCESYGGTGSRIPSEVVKFEYEELNNDMTEQMIEALNLPTRLTPEQVFERIKQEYDDKYDVVWLATEKEAREHYCDGDEPEGYNIPPDAIVLQDLGNDGALFLLPKQRGNPATPFTATWPPEPSHESPPPAPRNIPTEWFDEDGRAILPEHEEEYMDLLIYKFWRGDQAMNEKVMTKGVLFGRQDKEKEYEWAHWDGEYGLSINQYGPTDPSLPAGTLLRTIELNGVEIVYHILAPIKHEDKLAKLNRLSMRTHPDLVANAGRVGWAPEEERVPLAIAIDKTHFIIRKVLQQGRKYYPILNWIEIETWTQNGVEPDMKLAAVVGPGEEHMHDYDTIPIPEGTFHFDRMMSDRGFYIELESPPEPRPGSAAALEHLMFGNKLNAELKRIFNVALEVDVAEIPVEPTAIADIQERIDDIEREIRMLRAKEKDFSSSNSEVAVRLGKQEEYDKLMRERDEAMWRGNPGERRVVTKQDMRKRAKLPKLLYHGTSMQNLPKVLKEGLLVHQPHTPYTVESEHQEDTNMNVSLANTVQDAVFFSLGAAGWGADQAIIEFDTTKMTEEEYPAILRRPLFGKTGRFEYKFYIMHGIPPEHISRVLIRSFEKPAGHLEVTERWYTREEALSLPEPNA